jgi:hypothetical protein
MKIPKPFLFIFAAILALGAIRPSHARAQVSVSFFYDNLSPYGEWVEDPDYGYCWHPTNVDDNWAPYTDGYWAYTDEGWTWVSYEDYGGIVYHYGRWARIPDEGWVWVPGYTWAPAWVSWRHNDDYVGWAPLPPEARFRVGFGFGGWVDARFDIGPGFYSFVHVGDFGTPALGPVIVDREQNVTIINKTTNITNITYNNSNVYTGGPSYREIAARSTRPIPTLKLVRQGSPGAIGGAGGKFLAHQQGNQLMVIAPKVTAPATGKAPAPAKVAKTLTGGTHDNGWEGVKDPAQRTAIETKFKSEPGSTYTPAKSVKAEDLKIVTEKTAEAPKPFATTGESEEKTGKSKTLSTTDLENAPATEEHASTPEPSPKKSKSKKTPTENLGGNGESAGETPARKSKKSKKAKTPSYDESATGGSETPKHESSGDTNLQPFTSGDSNGSNSEKTPGYSDDTRPHESSGGGESGKGEKKKKKGKGEATPGE